MGWVCPVCSTNNMDSDTKCIVCDFEKASSGVRTLTYRKVQALGLTGNVIIPSEFNVIGEGAFKGRRDIYSVTLHSGVKKISKEAFSGCAGLASIFCYGRLESIGKRAFADCVSLPERARASADYVAKDAYKMTVEEYAPPLYSDETEEYIVEKTRSQKFVAFLLKLLRQIGILLLFTLLLGNIAYSFASNYQSADKALFCAVTDILLVLLLGASVYYVFADSRFKAFARETQIIPAAVVLLLLNIEHMIFGDLLIWVNVFMLLALLLGEIIFLLKTLINKEYRYIFILSCMMIISSAMLWSVIV